MDDQIEYKGYVIAGYAERWGASGYVGSYTIEAKTTGETIRIGRFVAFHDLPKEAWSAAVLFGKEFVDKVLRVLMETPTGEAASKGARWQS
jgi:hypothetical protein